ncbi:hypothetical protein NIES4074_49690 [Cylindrospermum sp. NIES-4074]|nr:hypothetical protein NIES4074_49690 [Cylindrospermum sp. NIES-4074]
MVQLEDVIQMYMIYSNFIDNLPAIIGLSLAGVWLIYKAVLIAYKLDLIRGIITLFNHRPIIMPSLFFIASPFIWTSIFHIYTQNLDNSIKAFTPITCIAAYIAYQQYQINRQQLRKNLSDKRLQIYVSVMTLITAGRKKIIPEKINLVLPSLFESEFLYNTEILQEKINLVLPSLFESEFLFGEEVNKKLKEICDKANLLIVLKNLIDDANKHGTEQLKYDRDSWLEKSGEKNKSKANENGERLNSYAEQYNEIREYFENEAPKIKTLFYPYINLSNIAIE